MDVDGSTAHPKKHVEVEVTVKKSTLNMSRREVVTRDN